MRYKDLTKIIPEPGDRIGGKYLSDALGRSRGVKKDLMPWTCNIRAGLLNWKYV
jgi:hypothetical protein